MNEKPKNPNLKIVRDDSLESESKLNPPKSSVGNINLEEFKTKFPEKAETIDALMDELNKENQKEERDLEKIQKLEFSLREIILS